MIVGIDAAALAVDDKRLKLGVYRVGVNLVQELSLIDKTNIYNLYTFSPIDGEILKNLGHNFQNIVLYPKNGWFTWRLPLALYKDKVDIFLGLSQALPLSTRLLPDSIVGRHINKFYSIGFIYDLAFLHHPEAYPDSINRLIRQTDQVIARADQIVTISKASASDIKRNFPHYDGAISVAYPGVGSQFVSRGLAFAWKRPYFLFVGSIKRGKNIGRIMRAFDQFIAIYKKPMDFLFIGGDYWRDPEIEQMKKNSSLKKRIHILGYVDDDLLPLLYRGARALVTPSLWEGFCLPAVEAMACGCPVIGSKTGAFPEVLGDAGILVDPLSEDAIFKALLFVISKKQYHPNMSNYSIQTIKRFSWGKFAKTIYSIYGK